MHAYIHTYINTIPCLALHYFRLNYIPSYHITPHITLHCTHTFNYTYIISVYIYVCVCVCVCNYIHIYIYIICTTTCPWLHVTSHLQRCRGSSLASSNWSVAWPSPSRAASRQFEHWKYEGNIWVIIFIYGYHNIPLYPIYNVGICDMM